MEEQILVEAMEDLEDDASADKIVETFVEMSSREIHFPESTPEPRCHECVCKDENWEKLDRLLSEKDAMIEEKSATIRGLMETTKN